MKLERIKSLSWKAWVIIVIFASLISAFGTAYVYSQNSSQTITIEPASFTETASYIIFRQDDTYYAKNGTTGEIEFSGTDASQVIQSAIDSTPEGGFVFVKGDIVIDSTITITKSITYQHVGKAILKATYLRLGSATTAVYRCRIWLDVIDGQDKTVDGIEIQNFAQGEIRFNRIYKCRYGVYINAQSNYVNDNKLVGNIISSCTEGIRLYADTNKNIEGWQIFVTFIAGCGVGWHSLGSGIVSHNIFIGSIDNADVSNSLDIKDETGRNIFITTFLRSPVDTYSVIPSTSVIVDKNKVYFSNADFLQDHGYVNILPNGGMEKFDATGMPVDWTEKQGGTTVTKETTTVYEGNSSVKLTSSADQFAYIGYEFDSGMVNFLRGKTITFSAYVKTSATNRVTIKIYDYDGSTWEEVSSEFHSGSGNWELLTATKTIRSTATQIKVRFFINSGTSIIAYFDAASIYIGNKNKQYTPTPLFDSRYNSGTATIPAGSTSVTVNHGLAGTPTIVTVTPSADIGDVWVDSVTSTSFTIHCETAPSSDVTVYWYAEYKP